MFVKKLVDKASKKPGGSLNSLKEHDVDPRLVFHYGIPEGAISLAYDTVQKILAVSTKDGRIKLYGKDNTQALLESSEAVPSKFLKFLENQGILLNVTVHNQIEVWDVDKKQLPHVHISKKEITSFAVVQQSSYTYVGDSQGNVSVLKFDTVSRHLTSMQYNIPLSASRGSAAEAAGDTAVIHTLPQPMAESKRVLVIFSDGLIILWGIQESKVLFIAGGKTLLSSGHEARKVTSACWACPLGTKVVVGYSNGEILVWSIPGATNSDKVSATDKGLCATQNVPISKINLGYKMDRIPIVSLKWVPGDGKGSRLYINGASDTAISNSFQIILLHDNAESRMIKMVLPLPEACQDMEIISNFVDTNKHKPESLLLLLNSGSFCIYDDSEIEKYLVQSQSRSPPTLPKQVAVKLPFVESSITASKYITDNTDLSGGEDKDNVLAKSFPSLFPSDVKEKDLCHVNSGRIGLTKFKNLYITGHRNGAINFWDASCPFLLPVLSVTQQSEGNQSLSGIPITALHFDLSSRVLASGDQSGTIRIFKFKPEQGTAGSNLFSLQATTKQGCSGNIISVKNIKLRGAVLCISGSPVSGQIVVGSDQGYVSAVDMEGPTIIYQKQYLSELYTGVVSLQFESYSLHGSEKNILLVALKDSSVLALEGDTGNALSNSVVRSKTPSHAIFMQILDGNGSLVQGSEGTTVKDAIPKQSSVLLCSEKAVYLFSLQHVAQGIKKVLNKKKFHGNTCCWASTFYSPCSDIGLVLLFASGRIEIRSLPDLALLRETSLRGFNFSTSNVCSSSEGELLVINDDKEIFFISLLTGSDIYRHLESISLLFKKDATPMQQGPALAPIIPKEKKKGIFSSVMSIKSPKGIHEGLEKIEPPVNIEEELATIFASTNFALDSENRHSLDINDSDVDIDIDDIDFDEPKHEPKDKPKGQSILTFNKQKLAGKLNTFKGKLKPRKVKTDNTSTKEENEDEKSTDTIDQIKKRYGYSTSGEYSAAKMAHSKLQDNLGKLQGINSRATEMQDTALSFATMAKQLLRTTERESKSS